MYNGRELLVKLASSYTPYADRERILNTGVSALSGALALPVGVKALDMMGKLKEKPGAKTYAIAALLGGAYGGLNRWMTEMGGQDRVEWLKQLAEDKEDRRG